MGCGGSSKITDEQPQKKNLSQKQILFKNNIETSQIEHITKVEIDDQHQPSLPKKSVAISFTSKHESKSEQKKNTLSHHGQGRNSVIKQSIPVSVNKEHIAYGEDKQRFSVDIQELLGKRLPTQLIHETDIRKQSFKSTHQTNHITESNENNQNEGNTHHKGINNQEQGQIWEGEKNVERKNRKEGNYIVFKRAISGLEKIDGYTKVSTKPQEDDFNFILDSLKNNSVFYSLSEDQIKEVISQMFLCISLQDTYLFRQGDNASAFFLIKSGRVIVEIDGQEKKELGRGTGVGELALLYNAPRSASIKCKEECKFWAIDRNTFRKTVEVIVQRDSQTNRKFMESVPFFNFMSDEQKDSIANALISVRFKQSDIIISEGDRADSFYLIKEGKVSVWKNGILIRNLFQSDSFGEQALYIKSTRAATVKADEEVKLLSLGRDDLTKILGGKKLTNIQVEKILMGTKISNYKSGTILYEEGDYCDTLIAVLEGTIIGEKSKRILADKGQIFGDKYLPLKDQNTLLDERVVIGDEAVLSMISLKQFHNCIGGDIESVIKKNVDSHEVKMRRENLKLDYSYINLVDLIYIKKLGVGQFGSVYLVQRSNTKELFALKCVSKAQIVEQSLQKHLFSEKQVLEMAQFPFLISFIRTFKDEHSVFFLLKFVSGMELFDVIRDIGLLSTFDSQFYIGSLILALEFLHSRHVIYRDVKPENVMIDGEGYLHLIDMGAAKILKSLGRTFTIIGTPHYMAPEVIKGKGYSYSVDLWSIGVCLYEFMCGVMPYAENEQDPYQIYEEINSKQLKFPSFLKDLKAQSLIEQLLNKQPELRLGGSYAALKTNPWFENFEWDSLYNKQIKAPYLPPIEKLISQSFIDSKYMQNKKIIHKIKQDQKYDQIKYHNEAAKDLDWDKEF